MRARSLPTTPSSLANPVILYLVAVDALETNAGLPSLAARTLWLPYAAARCTRCTAPILVAIIRGPVGCRVFAVRASVASADLLAVLTAASAVSGKVSVAVGSTPRKATFSVVLFGEAVKAFTANADVSSFVADLTILLSVVVRAGGVR